MKITEMKIRKTLALALATAMIATVTAYVQPVTAIAVDPTEVVVIASSDSDDKYKQGGAEQADYICENGVLTTQLKNLILTGNKIFRFAPGSYLINATTLSLNNNSIFEGINPIVRPLNAKDIMYPDPTIQAVFETRYEYPSSQEAGEQKGVITNMLGASNITIRNIAISGHAILKLNSLSQSTVQNVLIHNYRGTYTGLQSDSYPADGYTPPGAWCNMGYGGATSSLWVFGNCEDIDIIDCNVQFSSHHGVMLHSGDFSKVAKNINITGVRALYCGCGQLRGDNSGGIATSQRDLPEFDGHGYTDWSCAFDLCEAQTIENVVVRDCYALSGWKCGFYTEPEPTGGPITNLQFINCKAEDNGQRAWFMRSGIKTTIPRETESCNYFTQGGYYENCVSINGEKCGWLVMSNRTGANKPDGTGKLQLVNCGDMGSPISLVSEMFDSGDINADGFWSINPTKSALWLFGTDKIVFKNMSIFTGNQSLFPLVKTGYMLRQQFCESPNVGNLFQTTSKYAKYRANLTNSEVSGNVYNLSSTVEPVEIVADSTFNSYGNGQHNAAGSGITLARKTSSLTALKTTLGITDKVNDNWGKPVYTVNFNTSGGTTVANKTAIADTVITAPVTPKKTAYTFMGWYTAPTGGTKITFPFKVTDETIIYAQWKVAKPAAPTKVTAKRVASRTIRIKWAAATKVAGYSIYRAVKATGTYKRIANTKYLTYTNKKLIAGKYYYYKVRAYRMSGKTKVYGNMSKRIRARA